MSNLAVLQSEQCHFPSSSFLYQSNASWLRALENFLFDGDSFSLLSESCGSFRLLRDWGDPAFSQEMTVV